jgi:hypothetical protein
MRALNGGVSAYPERLRAAEHVSAPRGAAALRKDAVADALAELRAIVRADGGYLTAGSASVLLGHIDASNELVAVHLQRLQKNREATKAMRARRVAAGICVDCSQPARPGHSRCEQHAQRLIERTLVSQAKARRQAHEQGRCLECPEPAAPGKRRCQQHLAAAREQHRARRAKSQLNGGQSC